VQLRSRSKIVHSRSPVILIVIFLCFSFSRTGASQSLELATDHLAVPCGIVAPGTLTESLTCADKAEAIRRLVGGSCLSANTTSVTEVRKVWRDLASLSANAAARDPIVQALMAKCLVDARLGLDGPVDPSAVAYLRNALTDPSPALAGLAMIGLSPVLTKEDIATIVRVASAEPTLAMEAIMALSISCIPEAKSAVASIRAAAVGSPQAADIDSFLAESKDLCNRKGPLGPRQMNAPIAPAPNTALPLSEPDAAQVRAALDAPYGKPSLPYAKPSLQVLLAVQCTPELSDAVEEMRRAWHERNSPGASDTLQDPVAQAIIASCLITAAGPSERVTPDTVDAATLLRASIRSNDAMAVMNAVKGLAFLNANEDVGTIADVPRRMPSLLNAVIRFVGFTCGANNMRTLALIREELTTEMLRDQFDAVYKDVAEVRKQKRCADER
jgi:hypothetical protein